MKNNFLWRVLLHAYSDSNGFNVGIKGSLDENHLEWTDKEGIIYNSTEDYYNNLEHTFENEQLDLKINFTVDNFEDTFIADNVKGYLLDNKDFNIGVYSFITSHDLENLDFTVFCDEKDNDNFAIIEDLFNSMKSKMEEDICDAPDSVGINKYEKYNDEGLSYYIVKLRSESGSICRYIGMVYYKTKFSKLFKEKYKNQIKGKLLRNNSQLNNLLNI